MSPLLIALAAVQAVPEPPSAEQQFASCAQLARTQPEQAATFANRWQGTGGGLDARHCLGLAYAQLGRWEAAAGVFEQAAREAAAAHDPRHSDFWVQSGNSWLAADQAAKARTAFDAALALGGLSPELRGEVHFDRARAGVALGDPAAARTDIDRGLALAPADPFGWYISAALARREGNLQRARNDILKAVELAPREADILLEAGNIAGMAGDAAAARALFTRAAQAAPGSEAGRAAAAALAANAAPEPDQSR